jgi:cation diffusion facilitator CzcD-associated flavoprotein CzcO
VTQLPKPKLRVAVLGAGMSGILAAIRLQQAGVYEVVVFEKADRIGGTWRDNHYPGLTCDVPAHAYTFSFAPHAEWSSFLAPGPEIQQYFEGLVRQFQIESLIRFNQEVSSCVWQNQGWQLQTSSGLQQSFDIVIAATGVLHHLNQPEIKGLDSFAGDCFHSARWDHSVPLQGRRVGVIGNGSTGVQIVSNLAGKASRVVHIQRSPQWIMPYPNPPYSDADRAAFRSDPALIDQIRYSEFYLGLVNRFTEGVADKDSQQMAEIEAVVLNHLETSIRDPAMRERLRPNYRAACKRLIFSPDYFEVVQRDDVEVIVGEIAQIEPEGVRMKDGRLLALDVLALATGFKADRFLRPMTLLGQDGADLALSWARKPSAYLGIAMPGFPNFFMLNGPTGPVGNFSLIDIAERQWGYIDALLAELSSGRAKTLVLKPEVMQDYEARRLQAGKQTIFGSGCSSWYLDSEGAPSTWPWNYQAFAEQTGAPRLEEFERIG